MFDLQAGDGDAILELINTVAVSVGLLFLTLTILTLLVCQRGPKLTNAALLNLCLSLFFAHLTLLLTQQYLDSIKKDFSQVSVITEAQSPDVHHIYFPLLTS